MACAMHKRHLVHSILKAKRGGIAISHSRDFLTSITIPLLDFAFSSKLKLL